MQERSLQRCCWCESLPRLVLLQEISVCSQGSTQDWVSFDDNAIKSNTKQRHFCKKQGKDSVGTWQKPGDGLNPCVLQAGGPTPATAAKISRSSFSAEVGEMNPTGV